MRTESKIKAIELRQEGKLYSEIAELLGVSRSTAHAWTKDIVLSDDMLAKIAARQQSKMKRLASARDASNSRKLHALRSKSQAIIETVELGQAEMQLLCAVFVWCEGEKNAGSGLKFINSDPVMIATFMKLVRSSFELDETKFRALVHLHDYHDVRGQLAYWSEVTKIPLEQFNRPYIKPHAAKRIHKNYPGCISIRYNDASLGKLLQMIYGEFSSHLGV